MSPDANASNAQLVAILQDRKSFPNGDSTLNEQYGLNTLNINYLDKVKQVSNRTSPGIGSDLVYRDPWGSPYIVTLDLNYDGKCLDAFYSNPIVSAKNPGIGFNGLGLSKKLSQFYEYNGSVMVWSLGPDGYADKNVNAKSGANKDNILSW